MSDYSSRVEQARHDSWHPNECDRCLEQAVERIDGDYYCARHLPPDPDEVRVIWVPPGQFFKTPNGGIWPGSGTYPWIVLMDEYRTVAHYRTEAEAVSIATEDGSGWTPAELHYQDTKEPDDPRCQFCDRSVASIHVACPYCDDDLAPTFEIVLRVQVNETLAQVQTWPWEDMLNVSDAPIARISVESTKEVAR